MRLWKAFPEKITPESIETGLTFLGLAGLLDPPREEVRAAIDLCKTAGIKPVMITGDHPVTARAIAERLEIIEAGSDSIMTGRELEELSLEELEHQVEKIRVYARVPRSRNLR
jgi:Ca2+-transporting ATPase